MGKPQTLDQVDTQLADTNQAYLKAYFVPDQDEGLVRFYVLQIERLERLRNDIQRQESACSDDG